MQWLQIRQEEDIEAVRARSHLKPVLLFKHSTRCSISATAKARLERKWSDVAGGIEPVIIDVIQQRPISNAVADKWEVIHQSPQALLIKDGECVYTASHFSISLEDILQAIHK